MLGKVAVRTEWKEVSGREKTGNTVLTHVTRKRRKGRMESLAGRVRERGRRRARTPVA